MNKRIISARAAAERIGCSPQAVRERIRLGLWTFGGYAPKEKTGRTRDTFYIISDELDAFLSGGRA